MLVDIRPVAKLRGKAPVDVTASLGPVVDALREDTIDLSRVRVVCDWVQYRNNFRDVVDLRPIMPDDTEIALDLRRSGDVELKALADDLIKGRAGKDDRLYLEPWVPAGQSCIWQFNALYWQALDLWEQATGRAYEQALPGGESDARNRTAVRELIGRLFDLWDSLAARNSLPEELYVVELGVGNGNQAKTWLDEFVVLERERGTDYYRRLNYLMCDYSPHVLELARRTVAGHANTVSSFVLDATTPRTALGFLRYKVFLVYISNVYDNLPTDEVAQIGGRTYCVQSRAYLPADSLTTLARQASTDAEQIPMLVAKLLKLGPGLLAETRPEQFPTVSAAVDFWRAVWTALRLADRYVPLSGLDMYQIAPSLSGELLRPLLESGGDVRMHVSNGAVASFVDTLPLLHPYGELVCHDLFVTDVHAYRTGFRGPGKYDGSVVNWVNGSLLAHIGRRKGFDVSYAPFAHRAGTNIVTMTAQVRD